jgi:predicted metal-dependent phosphoesterase TrpH
VIDLHTHSTVSDGSDAPARIPELAAAAGCSAVALTDHDRLDGVVEAGARAAELGVTFVPGCELSCEFAGTMHLLVYWLEPGEGPLQDELVRLQEARETRNHTLAERLTAHGIPITYDEMVAEAGGGGVGRPHIAAILVRKGVVGSIQEAFDVWLAKGRPGYADRERLEPAQAIELAIASRGVPVLAHPFSLGLEPAATEAMLGELKARGLAGVEAVYGRYDSDQREQLRGMAKQLDLVATGGSDYHGTYKADLEVGIGRGDLDVPDAALDALATRRST